MFPIHEPFQSVFLHIPAFFCNGFRVIIGNKLIFAQQIRRMGLRIPVARKAVLLNITVFYLTIGGAIEGWPLRGLAGLSVFCIVQLPNSGVKCSANDDFFLWNASFCKELNAGVRIGKRITAGIDEQRRVMAGLGAVGG